MSLFVNFGSEFSVAKRGTAPVYYPQRCVISLGEDSRRWNNAYWPPGPFNFYGSDICASNLIDWMADGVTNKTVVYLGTGYHTNHGYFWGIWEDLGFTVSAWPYYWNPPTNTLPDCSVAHLSEFGVVVNANVAANYTGAVWEPLIDNLWTYIGGGGRLWQSIYGNTAPWDWSTTVDFLEPFDLTMKAADYLSDVDMGHPMPDGTVPMTAGTYGDNTGARKLVHAAWWFDDSDVPANVRMYSQTDAYLPVEQRKTGGVVACYNPNGWA